MEVREWIVKCILCETIVHAKGHDDEVWCKCGNVRIIVGDTYAEVHSSKGFDFLGKEGAYVQPDFPNERNEETT